jgi:NTP pyrophosphatase (non-canonical NTP hydrolase)
MPTDLKTLEAAMHDFVERKGWYAPDSAHPQTPKNLAVSLVLEATEVLEHFQWTEHSTNREALAGELADVLLYLMQIASLYEIDLAAAVTTKLAINDARHWE